MASFRVLNVGFSNIVASSKVLAVLSADSSSSKRLRLEAKNNGKLLDATQGRKTRSLVVTDTGHIVLSSIRVESLTKRIESDDNTFGKEDEETEDE